MNIRRLVFILFSFLVTLSITHMTFQRIIKQDSTVDQPALITMTDLGYDHSKTTNAIVRTFVQSGYSGKMYSLKIETESESETISFHLDLLKCDNSDHSDDFYHELLVDAYHSERKIKACGFKDNCHVPKLDYEKTISHLFEMDSESLDAEEAYAFFDPFSAVQDKKHNEIYILKDTLVLCIKPWGMNHPFTQKQFEQLMTLFDQADIIFEDEENRL